MTRTTRHLSSLRLQLLDTTPSWLGLTLVSSAFFFVAIGIGIILNQFTGISITPFTLLLHLVLAVSLSAWILNLRIRMSPERRALLSMGLVVALGSLWSTLQQWVGYVQNGITSDLALVAGATLMDAAGGCVTYVLFHLNVLRK